MCAGVGGSPAAAALTAALAVGAGGAGGAREVFLAMQDWLACGRDLAAWQLRWSEQAKPSAEPPGIWPAAEHPAGFDPLGVTTPTPVKQVLARLAMLDADSSCAWLQASLSAMEQAAGHPLSLLGVAAAAFTDLGMLPEEGEMLF
jgi:citrate synthase